MSVLKFFKGNVLNLSVTMAIFAFAEQMFTPYLSLYILALGGDVPTIGLVNSLGTIASLFILPIGGYIADYKGRVKIIAIMSYLYAFSSLFFIFAPDWKLIILGLAIQRISLSYTPALSAIQADSLLPRMRGLGFSLFRFIPGIAALASPYIAGYLITVYGTSNGVRICYVMLLLCGIVAATIRSRLKETLTEQRSDVPIRNLPLLFVTSYKAMLGSLKGIHKTMWVITAISVVNTFFISMVGPFWVVYATGVIKLSVLDWGLILLCMTGLRIVISLPAGRIVDRVGRKKCILASLALMPIPMITFIYSKTFIQVLAGVLFIELLDDFLMPSTQALVADLIPKERRGLINSVLGRGTFIVTVGGGVGGGTIAMFLPYTIGVTLGGYIYNLNPVYPWLILAPTLVICTVLTALFIHEPEKPEE